MVHIFKGNGEKDKNTKEKVKIKRNNGVTLVPLILTIIIIIILAAIAISSSKNGGGLIKRSQDSVIKLSVSELNDRIELAKQHGINAFNSLDVEVAHKFIYSKTDEIGADCIFMTSGADAAIPLALQTVRLGGKILIFASTPKNMGYANNEIYYKELTVLGSYSPRPQDLETSLQLLTNGEVNVKYLSTVYQAEDIQKAFDDTMSNKIMKAYIKF